MATYGAIRLSDAANPTAGATFSLAVAPSRDLSITCGEATVALLKGQRDIAIYLPANTDSKVVLKTAYAIAQRALDIVSLRYRMHLALRTGAAEHILWWHENDRMILREINTASFPLPELRMTGVIRRNDGSQEVVLPPDRYSLALRFYRLAQLTDDLYEMFRYLYLAFEHLLSGYCPKRKNEKERPWLLRALTQADDVTAAVSMATDDSAEGRANALVNQIYTTRVRLFHSKVGEVAYLPHDSLDEQQTIGDHARLLLYLIVRMLDCWHEVRGSRGEFSSYAIETIVAPLVHNIHMVASSDTSQLDPDNGGLQHPRFETGVRLKTKIIKNPKSIGDYWIRGSINEPTAHGLKTVQRIDVVNDQTVLFTTTDESLITLDGVAHFDRRIRIFPFAQWLPKVFSGYK